LFGVGFKSPQEVGLVHRPEMLDLEHETGGKRESNLID
jgi:hypothetical protein